uniref:Uncharacterized protein n=1 Tax=Romanomermis culicivorax TaxID=13658 RepID=A0A915JX74_ROMCU
MENLFELKLRLRTLLEQLLSDGQTCKKVRLIYTRNDSFRIIMATTQKLNYALNEILGLYC